MKQKKKTINTYWVPVMQCQRCQLHYYFPVNVTILSYAAVTFYRLKIRFLCPTNMCGTFESVLHECECNRYLKTIPILYICILISIWFFNFMLSAEWMNRLHIFALNRTLFALVTYGMIYFIYIFTHVIFCQISKTDPFNSHNSIAPVD